MAPPRGVAKWTGPTVWLREIYRRPLALGLGGTARIKRLAKRNIGAPGFEPGTSPTRTVRATRLRHAPNAAELSQTIGAVASGRPPGHRRIRRQIKVKKLEERFPNHFAAGRGLIPSRMIRR